MTIWVINVLTGGRGCEGGQVWGHARRRGCGTARTRPAGAADIVGRLMRGEVCVECSRKPVKQHICCFYWLTRGGEVAAVGLAGGGVLVHKECPRGRGSIVSTQTFVDRAGVGGVAVQRWLRVLLLCFVGW